VLESIAKDLTEPGWWFSVCVAGIIVNVTAAFLKDWLARTGARFSGRRKQALAKREAARKARVEAWSKDRDRLARAYFAELRLEHRVLLYIGCASLFLLMTQQLDVVRSIEPTFVRSLLSFAVSSLGMAAATIAIMLSLLTYQERLRLAREISAAEGVAEANRQASEVDSPHE
jgi:hypothetical protein